MDSGYPPGPKSNFFGLDFVRRLQQDIQGFSAELANEYGDIVYYRCGPYRNYQVTHPEYVHEVLVKQARRFHKPPRIKREFGKFEGKGLLLRDGKFWRQRRQLIQPAFHPTRLPGYGKVMIEVTHRMLDRWHHGLEVNLANIFHALTLTIIAKALFDTDLSSAARHLGEAVAIIQQKIRREISAAIPLPDWLPLPSRIRERKAIKTLRDFVLEIIRQRRSTAQGKDDLLSMLLPATDGKAGSGGLTEIQARDEALTQLFLGHETTATALVWAAYLLAKHPEVQEKLAREVDRALGGRPLTAEDIPKLGYAAMVVMEGMRLYPPVYFFSRKAIDDVEIAGYRIRKGSLVHLVPEYMHRDPRWFKEPENFLPERFAPGWEDRTPQCAYIPFGAGPRVCPGKAFAMMETVIVLSSIVQRYQLTLVQGEEEPEVEAQVTLHPKGGIRFIVKQRETGSRASTPHGGYRPGAKGDGSPIQEDFPFSSQGANGFCQVMEEM